jgi:hypothetical protein
MRDSAHAYELYELIKEVDVDRENMRAWIRDVHAAQSVKIAI